MVEHLTERVRECGASSSLATATSVKTITLVFIFIFITRPRVSVAFSFCHKIEILTYVRTYVSIACFSLKH